MNGTGALILCTSILCMLILCSSVAESVHVEYERSGTCDITQECVYKYQAEQSNYGEEEREVLSLSTDVNWHCESSGMFGEQKVNEYCFTLSSTRIDINTHANSTTNNSSENMADFLTDELDGEFCYVQTSDGKIVSIHYALTDNYQGINIKRSIASTFQANFDSHKKDIEETDAGSVHTSHYSFDKASKGTVMFSRDIEAEDLIQMPDGASGESSGYVKHEQSVFVDKILQKSQGKMKIKLDFGDLQDDDLSNDDDVDTSFDFGKEFESNGTYLIEKAYCKKRDRRSAIFSDLSAPSITKATLLATIDTSNFEKNKIRKMRNAIPSVPGLLEQLRKSPNNTEIADRFQQLLELEAQHGAPTQYTPAISQIIEYYKKVQWSEKPQDVKFRQMIYAFMSADGSSQSQEILASLLTRRLSEDERDALLHQLIQLSKPKSNLVDAVISINPSNDDNLVLVLGALARNNDDAIQSKVVKELLRRLSMTNSSGNSSDAVVFINYALGNTGSRLAIDALQSSLSHEDVDTQISAIRGLNIHIDQPSVQQALIHLLKTSTEDAVLEEILTILIDAFGNKVLRNPSKELLNAIVDMTTKLENANLYELLIQYLRLVGANETQEMINIIMQQHNYGHVTSDHVSDVAGDTRIKRGSNWDSKSKPDYYNLVASYKERRHDVQTYPTHKAYIWGAKRGISSLELKVGVGAFVGAYCGGTTNRLKVFGKAVAKVHVLGKDYNIAHMEYSDHTSGDTLYHKVYVKLGKSVIRNINTRYTVCRNKQAPLWDRSRTVFERSFYYFIYVENLKFTIRAKATTTGTAGACMCPLTLRACVNLKPSVSLRITGDGSADLLKLIRGGIEVNADFQYYMEPHACIQALTARSCTSASIKTCLQLYHGNPSYVNIVPYWQRRKWGGWTDRKEWEAHRWTVSDGSRKLLWSSCSPPITPCTP